MDPKMKSAKEDHNKEDKEERKLKDTQEEVSEQSKAPNNSNTDGSDTDNSDLKSKDSSEDTSTPEELLALEKDRVLRLSAEFDNYKKRKQREIDDFKKFANESVFRQILPVVDNLERAIDAAQKNADHTSLLEGVQMTHKEIMKLLELFSVKLVQPDKEAFDPNFHQAVTRQETDDFPENTVVKVLQNGYLLHNRLIRPAMVIVSKKIEQKAEDKDQEVENKEQKKEID
jgi:molecular chaperone GrpE